MSEPSVTAVLATDSWRTAAETMAHLRRQTVAAQLEVVLVGPGLAVPGDAAEGFHALVVVESTLDSLSGARAQGILQASAPAVYVAETHGFPRPDCIELLCSALTGDVVAAMPRFCNANPASARSWASLFVTYGAFTTTAGGAAPYVGLHNGAFRSPVVQDVARHPADLTYGVGLSGEIARQGARVAYVAGAVVDHLNVETLAGIRADRFVGGRLWASLRARSWSHGRRLGYAAAAPAAAAVAARRVLRHPGWRETATARPRGTTAAVLAMVALQAAGEAAGYVAGPGDAERRHGPLELHRRAYTL